MAIAHGLRFNKSIMDIDLRTYIYIYIYSGGNKIESQGIESFARMLQLNTVLKELCLSIIANIIRYLYTIVLNMNFHTRPVILIVKALLENKSLKVLLLGKLNIYIFLHRWGGI